MKKVTKFIIISIITIIMIMSLTGCTKKQDDDGKYRIVTSFYPMYIMTANIIDGANNIELTNMTDVNVRMHS